ncbi:hypothetical protein FF38_03268 [Lucilia cuprina]|uniref:Uncharacterized protein n=1 Tax=Lucilia cuprina TaxID=7375 RepID=A0A0L0BS37_LUCCU|nr:hypothetical protein FF38_03268 [Lucilia cuprina]
MTKIGGCCSSGPQVTVQEISDDLAASPIPPSLCGKVLDWLCSKWDILDQVQRATLLTAIKLDVGESVLSIGDFNWFYDSGDLPDPFIASNLPRSCFSENISKHLDTSRLAKIGIRPLNAESWVSYIIPLTLGDAVMCGKVLKSIYRIWDYTGNRSRAVIYQKLQVACVPTNKGLQKPESTYTQEIKLFPDLPVIDQNLDLPTKWLSVIGMRVSVDMKYVLEALISHSLEWTNDDLLQYLHENAYALKKIDWKTLSEGQFFLPDNSNTRLRARDLFSPDNDLKSLGLPTIKLERFSFYSPEMKVLKCIGLRTFPKVSELFNDANIGLIDFYYPIYAHELAHNLAASHGAKHTFYMGAYIQSTLKNISSVQQAYLN